MDKQDFKVQWAWALWTHPTSLEPHLGPGMWGEGCEGKAWQRWRKVSLAHFLAWSSLLWWPQVLAQHAMALWCHEQCLALPFVQEEKGETVLEVPMMTTTSVGLIHHLMLSKYSQEQPWRTPWDGKDLKQGEKGDTGGAEVQGQDILLFCIQFWYWTFSESAYFSSMSNKNSRIHLSLYLYTYLFIYIFIYIYTHL